jgi:hypothetical protein
METLKATTTFRVVDVDITKTQFKACLVRALVKGGWYKEPINPKDEKTIASMANTFLNLASSFPIGAILERRGTVVSIRKHASKIPFEFPSEKGLD